MPNFIRALESADLGYLKMFLFKTAEGRYYMGTYYHDEIPTVVLSWSAVPE